MPNSRSGRAYALCMGIGRRSLEVLRAEGPRGLWWRGLGVTVYRRLILVSRRLESRPRVAAKIVVDVKLLEDGAPVSTLWFATLRAEFPYLELVFDLPDGVGYVYDVYHYLDEHPQIGMSRPKELRFFADVPDPDAYPPLRDPVDRRLARVWRVAPRARLV